jgi:hypothetical protein
MKVLARMYNSTLIAALGIALSASLAVAGPMQLTGEFGVGSTGSAQYHVPIAVPPGTAGMMPSLSLDYDSDRGSGIVGVGWSLNGFSAIRRCPQTVAQDSAAGRVGYDTNDRYCLDGARLMAISGTYGANLTEYRTEIESFKKVISNGTAGNGPSWFEVRLPSGRILEYGNTADSKILAKGKTSVRVWALNKIADTKGNYLTITYNNDTTNGSYYPTQINYTGNAAAGLATYASVQFTYVARPATDQVTAYVAGSSIKLVSQLSQINTFTGGSQVLAYKLAYEPTASGASGGARLASIQMCDAANLCQPATTFTWSNTATATVSYGAWQDWLTAPGAVTVSAPGGGMSGPPLRVTNSTPSWGGANSADGDIDGDGRHDILVNNSGAISISLSTGTGFTPLVNTGIATYGAQLIDIFNNGRSDIISMNSANQLVRFPNNGAGGFSTTPVALKSIGVSHPTHGDNYSPIYGDLNGDGFPDILWHNAQNTFTLALNNGTGFGTNQAATRPANMQGTHCQASGLPCSTQVYGYATKQFANLTGRGNVDLVFTYQSVVPYTCAGMQNPNCTGYTTAANPGPWEVWYALWNGASYSAPVKVMGVAHQTALDHCGTLQNPQTCPNVFPVLTTRVADVNGDGLSDLFISYPQSTGYNNQTFAANQFLYVSNGTNLNAVAAPGFSNTSCSTGLVFNSIYTTNATDAICEHDTAIRISRPNAAGTNYPALSSFLTAAATGKWWLRDFNGDGFLDFLVQSATNHYWVALSNRIGGAPADLLTGITTGLGATTTISYDAPAHNPSTSGLTNYTRATTPVTYPMVDITPRDYVVTRVDRSNGIGGLFSTSYRYNGARFDLVGRGFLTYTNVTAKDLGTNVETISSYGILHPYTGLLSAEVKVLGPSILSALVNNYSATSLGGSRYFPFVMSSTLQRSDLDGSALPNVTTTYQYDAYGNPTVVASTASDGYSNTVTNTYTNDLTRWILGLLTQTQVTSTVP